MRSVSSVVNDVCTRPSNFIWGSDFDCSSYIKNDRFHELHICAIKRTWQNCYFLCWISNTAKGEKVKKKNIINDFREELDKGNNATCKRSVSSVVNSVCTRPSRFIGGSEFDCSSHIKNGRFHEFHICAIKRTW